MGMPVGASGGFSARIAMPMVQRQAQPPAPSPAASAGSNTAAKVIEQGLNSEGPRGTMVNTQA